MFLSAAALIRHLCILPEQLILEPPTRHRFRRVCTLESIATEVLGFVSIREVHAMIHVIEPCNAPDNNDVLRGMFSLRARIFKQKLGWDVNVADGIERDHFDDENPIYVVHTNSANRVDGCCRLLPTTGPTLIEEVFADTIPDVAKLSSPAIWECTRLCVDSNADLSVSAALISSIGKLALVSGVDTILGNFDRSMLQIYRRVGCEVTILGSTTRFERPVFLGSFPVSKTILDQVNARIDSLMTRKAAA